MNVNFVLLWKRASLLILAFSALVIASYYVDQNRTGAQPLPSMTPEEFRQFEKQFIPSEMTPDRLEEFARKDFLLLDIYLVVFAVVSVTIVSALASKPSSSLLFAVATVLSVGLGAAGFLSAPSALSMLGLVMVTYAYVAVSSRLRGRPGTSS